MLFVGMLVFQLSGALVLLLNCIKGGKSAVIKSCFPGTNVVERDENNNCKIEKEKLQKSAHNIYLNIIAFADLVVGYILAAFSPVADVQTSIILIEVIVLTCILLIVEYYLSRFCVRKIYAEDMVIPFADLDGVDTVATEKEIDDICNDVFKE